MFRLLFLHYKFTFLVGQHHVVKWAKVAEGITWNVGKETLNRYLSLPIAF